MFKPSNTSRGLPNTSRGLPNTSRGLPNPRLPNPRLPNPRPLNWPLIIGSALVGLILLLAIFGPSLAPNDPREHKLIIQIDGKWKVPPYPAFTPGYPLGSDNLGRDLYSWLLWSIRPTMLLLLSVAGLRMSLGVVMGVGAGYSDRWLGRVCDSLIAAALAVPALLAALIVITAVGFHLGVWSFVLGLAITGWAETAQLVREQTRTIKSQQAVEAAHALGATHGQIFFLHILPQVMPMIWMLLAFEISNTLVTTAGLGFLGYYLGGAVFTEVDDFVYQRISEMPELGQMLATAWMVLDEPWAMVAAGTVVFLIVLAFNLVGEGLQQRLTRNLGGLRKLYTHIAGYVLPWLSDIFSPRVRLVLTTGALLSLIGGGWWWRSHNAPNVPSAATVNHNAGTISTPASLVGTPHRATVTPPMPPTSRLPVPGGHIWASERHDPWGTLWLGDLGPQTAVIGWTFETDAALTGGPAIAADGTLYVSTASGAVLALSSAGEPLWEAALTSHNAAVGAPALSSDGTLYVVDLAAGLSAFSPVGDFLWHRPADFTGQGYTSPIVAPSGDLYYLASRSGSLVIIALTPNGAPRWQTALAFSVSRTPPQLSPSGAWLFWEDKVIATADGTILPPMPEVDDIPSPDEHYRSGADGNAYLREGGRFQVLHTTDAGLIRGEKQVRWYIGGQEQTQFNNVKDSGATADGIAWQVGNSRFGSSTQVMWGALAEGGMMPALNEQRFSVLAQPQVLAVDAVATLYLCGTKGVGHDYCYAVPYQQAEPLWDLGLPADEHITGGALAPYTLYLATDAGRLYVIGSPSATHTLQGHNADVDTASAAHAATLVSATPPWESPLLPGDHPWPAANHDPWGTRWTAAIGPQAGAIAWTYQNPVGFSSAPVVANDGTLYLGTLAGTLLALEATGDLRWVGKLNGGAVGSPALGAEGTVYVTDSGGFLSAFTPDGELLWLHHATNIITRTLHGQVQPLPLEGLSPAGTGPVVAPDDGTLYYSLATETMQHEIDVYLRGEVMIAVSPAGLSVLEHPPSIWSNRAMPRFLPGEAALVWSTGSIVGRNADCDPTPLYAYVQELHGDDGLRRGIFNGANGKSYLAYRRTFIQWSLENGEVTALNTFTWEAEPSPGIVQTLGATPDDTVWMFFRGGKFVWVPPSADQNSPDQSLGVIGPVRFPLESEVIAVDVHKTVYGCGNSMGKAPECMAYAMGTEDPLWHITLAEGETVLGGALVSGVLYVATEEGNLYAIGD